MNDKPIISQEIINKRTSLVLMEAFHKAFDKIKAKYGEAAALGYLLAFDEIHLLFCGKTFQEAVKEAKNYKPKGEKE